MAAQVIDARILVQVRLALARTEADARAADLERQARAAGLTGAEIDAARGGRCFDVRADAAVGYALALRAADGPRIRAALLRARHSGLGAREADAIEQMSRPGQQPREQTPCVTESGPG